MNNTRNNSSCTAVLVGKNATVDGSTMIARNEDAGGGINPKRFVVVTPDQQPTEYISTFNGFKLTLPADPLRYTETPCADVSDGVWGESGINTDNVAMSSTETEFTNTTVLGIDPLVDDGIGEEAMLTVVLPYIHSAREGVKRLGALITKYGTCESNGIAFSDQDESGTLRRLAAITGQPNGFRTTHTSLPLTKLGFKKLILMTRIISCTQMI